MTQFIQTLEFLKKNTTGYWSDRVLSELNICKKISELNQNSYDTLITQSLDQLSAHYASEQCISKTMVLSVEAMLQPLSKKIKAYSIACAAHAHIDMNWMWGYAETVGTTLDTFRTMLRLMEEYPDFTFSQSQASVYEIVEKFDLNLLAEIKKRVQEGRWEVTASTWVETDKNMPNGESLTRHILYTKNYLSQLLGLDPKELNIDFEPDTFGHNVNVPEILQNGGVDYYYHCRGYEGHHIYKWRSPSGKEVIVYREPLWYNSEIESTMGLFAIDFCEKHGIRTFLKVYGVGDHGGGPTISDIEKIIDMQTWPLYPSIHFGTFKEFFAHIKTLEHRLPIVEQELNFVFTGCYTSQSRIKLANRKSEENLCDAEIFNSLATIFGDGSHAYPTVQFENAWRNTLFNQFHDILPGSGVIETREHAMGLFQETMAITNTASSSSLRHLVASVDTQQFLQVIAPSLDISLIENTPTNSKSEGAGVGYGAEDYRLTQVERGSGLTRYIHVFNPSPYDRTEVTKITLWDWEVAAESIQVMDEKLAEVVYQVVTHKHKIFNDSRFFGHQYTTLLIDAKVPAFGYTTYMFTQRAKNTLTIEPLVKIEGNYMSLSSNPRMETIASYTLENELIKVDFDPLTLKLKSLTSKPDQKTLIDEASGMFQYIKEDVSSGMTSWVVGQYISVESINDHFDVTVIDRHLEKGSLRQWIEYTVSFHASSMTVKVSLDSGSQALNYEIKCDWQERPVKGKYVPQLKFALPLSFACDSFTYDIPFGTIVRKPLAMDVTANSFIHASDASHGLLLVSDSKYGFRGNDNEISLTLLRSSYNPDPYPEIGNHQFSFSIHVTKDAANSDLIRQAYNYNHQLPFVSGKLQKGTSPLGQSFVQISSTNLVISSMKIKEKFTQNHHILLRLYETNGQELPSIITCKKGIARCYFVDANENELVQQEDHHLVHEIVDSVSIQLKPLSMATLCIEFQ
ncbi:MAG: alpha-mannosidase [Vallitaleaceae bacterium]|nr:alpha-mannosidase [Vallitaleaceae bacterium]